MLQAIRGKAASWIVKILFALLILSFGIWGIGDIFRSAGPDETVAEVGDLEISAQTLDRSVRRQVDQFQRLYGPDFDLRLAIELNVPQQVLERLIGDALFAQETGRLGLRPGVDLMAEQIRTDSLFADPGTGQFNRERFEQVLAAGGMTEPEYVASEAQTLARRQLAAVAAGGAAPPDALVDILYRYRFETRRAETLTLTNDAITDVPEPTQEELEAYHQENAARFTAPEYRALTLVTLTPEDLASEMAIADEDVYAEYEARIGSYDLPEKRAFNQVVIQDEATARAVAEAARAQDGGLADALAQSEVEAPMTVLAPTTRDDMPLPELGDAGFSLPLGGVSEPVHSPFGWHILELTRIEEAGAIPFDDVKDEIAESLRYDRALDGMYEIANAFDDALAGGASLEEAAAQAGLSVVTIAPVSRSGETLDGEALPEIEALPQAIEEAFKLEDLGDQATTPLIETDRTGYFIVRVDDVVPPALRPLDTIRDEVAQAWTEDQREQATAALALAAAERLDAGDDFATVSEATGGTLGETPELLRDGSNRDALPSAFVTQLFQAHEGDVIVAQTPQGQIVARLTAIVPALVGNDNPDRDQVAEETAQQMGSDFLEQFAFGLRGIFDVSIHQRVIDRLYASADDDV
ncbi:MAG: SurA N-terminal domain-containing protein [Rhodospirillaceae bacterium]|nr:SurA N-terminal domain-containing protein [Rhodospirillaceae bacterium]